MFNIYFHMQTSFQQLTKRQNLLKSKIVDFIKVEFIRTRLQELQQQCDDKNDCGNKSMDVKKNNNKGFDQAFKRYTICLKMD